MSRKESEMRWHANNGPRNIHMHQQTFQQKSQTSPKTYTYAQAHIFLGLQAPVSSSIIHISGVGLFISAIVWLQAPEVWKAQRALLHTHTTGSHGIFVSVLLIHTCTCWLHSQTQNIPEYLPQMHTHTRSNPHCHLSQYVTKTRMQSHNDWPNHHDGSDQTLWACEHMCESFWGSAWVSVRFWGFCTGLLVSWCVRFSVCERIYLWETLSVRWCEHAYVSVSTKEDYWQLSVCVRVWKREWSLTFEVRCMLTGSRQ